jgi:UDP-N-acetylmuramoyl-tripeptide--D-alanyl-D-alanine ligase
MASALENLYRMKAGKKAVILGDMKELGETSEDEHRDIGKWLKKSGFHHVFLFGDLMSHAADEYPGAHFFTNKDELKKALKSSDLSQHLILIKGSRSMGLEEVLDDL